MLEFQSVTFWRKSEIPIQNFVVVCWEFWIGVPSFIFDQQATKVNIIYSIYGWIRQLWINLSTFSFFLNEWQKLENGFDPPSLFEKKTNFFLSLLETDIVR